MAKRLLSESQWGLIDAALRDRGLSGDTPLMDIAKMSAASVSRWRSGTNGISEEKLRLIARGLKIPFAQLADPDSYAAAVADDGFNSHKDSGESDDSLAAEDVKGVKASAPPSQRRPRIVETEYVYYPVLGRANCGPGGGAYSGGESESAPVPTATLRLLSVARTEDLKLIEMAGACMTPDVQDGDYALFDPNTVAAENEIVCVTILHQGAPEGEHIVKRISYLEGDRIALTPNVPVPGMPGRQEFNRDDVIIEGVLVSVIHNINRPPRVYPLMSYRRGTRLTKVADTTAG